jgi:hypothetical protein
MSWTTEGNQVHVNALFCNAEETKHQEQIFTAVLADPDLVAAGCQLLEFTETAEKVVDARNNQGKVP